MGYVGRMRRFKLEFEGEEREGLEVRARSCPFGEILEFMDLAETPREQLKDGKESARMLGLLGKFIENVTSWNVQHVIDDSGDEEQIIDTPRTVEGLLMHDMDLVLDMSMAWMEAVVSFGRPLERKSSAGEMGMPPMMMQINPGS